MWREDSKESKVKAGREMSGRQPSMEVLAGGASTQGFGPAVPSVPHCPEGVA